MALFFICLFSYNVYCFPRNSRVVYLEIPLFSSVLSRYCFLLNSLVVSFSFDLSFIVLKIITISYHYTGIRSHFSGEFTQINLLIRRPHETNSSGADVNNCLCYSKKPKANYRSWYFSPNCFRTEMPPDMRDPGWLTPIALIG